MNLPNLAPYASQHTDSGDWAAAFVVTARRGLTLSGGGKGGGGGGGPQPPASGVCARSCFDCSNSGWRSCSYNQWCANRYPSGPYSSGLPYACG